MVKISLALLGLLGEDVAVVSMLPLDFSRSGKREEACFLLIFPDPVSVKRFLAPELVLSFAIVLIINC